MSLSNKLYVFGLSEVKCFVLYLSSKMSCVICLSQVNPCFNYSTDFFTCMYFVPILYGSENERLYIDMKVRQVQFRQCTGTNDMTL